MDRATASRTVHRLPADPSTKLNGCASDSWTGNATFPSDQRSLVAYLLDPSRHTWMTGVPHVWDHPESRRFPTRAAVAMGLGRDLDQLVHGVRIIYNYLCAQRRPDHGDARDQQLETYATPCGSGEKKLRSRSSTRTGSPNSMVGWPRDSRQAEASRGLGGSRPTGSSEPGVDWRARPTICWPVRMRLGWSPIGRTL